MGQSTTLNHLQTGSPKRPPLNGARGGRGDQMAEKSMSQAALAFVEFLHEVNAGRGDIRRLREFAPYIEDARFEAAVETALAMQRRNPAQLEGSIPDSEIRIAPPIWKKPTAAERKKGKKSWTTKVRNFDLRVEYKKTKAEGVMFHGYINNEHVGADKVNSAMQGRCFNEAVRRIRQGG